MHMVRNRAFDTLIADANVSARDRRGRVLKKFLNEDDVMPGRVVDVRGVPFAERVGADVGIAEVVADGLQILLNGAFRYGEQPLVSRQAAFCGVVAEEGVDLFGDGESAAFARFLLDDVEAKSATIAHDVRQFQLQNIAHAHSEIGLCGQNRRDAGIGAEGRRTRLHGADDVLILVGCEGYHQIAPSSS